MTQKFHVKPAGKDGGEFCEDCPGGIGLAIQQLPPHRSLGSAGKGDQPLGVFFQNRHGDLGVGGFIQIGLMHQFHEVMVAGFVLNQQHQWIGFGRLFRTALGDFMDSVSPPWPVAGEVQLAADDRLHAGLGGGGREFQGSEHVVGIGDRHRRHFPGPAQFQKLADGDGAFRKGIGCMDAQVNEIGIGHG